MELSVSSPAAGFRRLPSSPEPAAVVTEASPLTRAKWIGGTPRPSPPASAPTALGGGNKMLAQVQSNSTFDRLDRSRREREKELSSVKSFKVWGYVQKKLAAHGVQLVPPPLASVSV